MFYIAQSNSTRETLGCVPTDRLCVRVYTIQVTAKNSTIINICYFFDYTSLVKSTNRSKIISTPTPQLCFELRTVCTFRVLTSGHIYIHIYIYIHMLYIYIYMLSYIYIYVLNATVYNTM